MKVVILAGGYGTRLSEITSTIPKPMVDIAGKPLLWYIMNIYSSQGFNDFVIACGYKGDKIKEYFSNLSNTTDDFTIDMAKGTKDVVKEKTPDWKVTVVDTGLDTLTGGRLKKVAEYISEDTFMLTYGDGVADININGLLRFHRSHGKKATITAVRMPRFGVLQIENDGRVSSFQEKRLEHSPLINGGFMVLSKSVLDYIDNDHTPLESLPMQKLSEDEELYAYVHNGFWKCVDTLRDKQELEDIIKNREVGLWKD
jgi:glucose-1-phosphate cytidylyltransferase